MNTSQPRSLSLAFTLIELLTVIAIIAILMGLLFPAIGVVKESARKAQARNDCVNIVAAVKQYYAEYGKYPTVTDTPSTTNEDTIIGGPEANSQIDNNALFNTLRAIPQGLNDQHKYNPRRVVFFEGKAVTDIQAPRAGFADKSEAEKPGAYYDPWGKQYAIAMDTNYDNVLSLDGVYNDFGSSNAPRVGVGAFSLGRDNTLGTKNNRQYKQGSSVSDDQISWQ